MISTIVRHTTPAVTGILFLLGCSESAGSGAITPPDGSGDIAVSIEAPAVQPAGKEALVTLHVRNEDTSPVPSLLSSVRVTGLASTLEPLDGGSLANDGITWPLFPLGAGASRNLRFRLSADDVGDAVIHASVSASEDAGVLHASADHGVRIVPGVAVAISAPASGATWHLGDTIPLAAHVIDHRDAAISAAIQWTSSLAGVLGSGATIRRHDLASGRHTVRAIATANGVSDTAVVVANVSECGPFGLWTESEYVLPYPVGTSYVVNQSNCSGFGHSAFWKHGYDFIMDIGTDVVAARGGTAGWANDGCDDGNSACTNLITVIHGDGTVALYSHLTNGGVLVASGDAVTQGQHIGRSGNTGNTGGLPHLHFSLHPCNELPGLPGAGDCPTIPANFRITTANPHGPQARTAYRAN